MKLENSWKTQIIEMTQEKKYKQNYTKIKD